MPATQQTPDLYALLGVSPEATQDEIRKAYLKLAHKYHPDKTGGDKAAEEKLKEINQAYDVLKNPDKRKQYDQLRQGGFRFNGMPGGQGAGFEGFDFGGGASFEDLFASLFGGGGGATGTARARHAGPQPGADLEVALTVSLREAAKGSKRTLRVQRQEVCADCHGSGAAPGTTVDTCSQCGGSGQVRQQRGPMLMRSTCPKCHGRGKSIVSPCGTCHGRGTRPGAAEIVVDIPAGVPDHARLRLMGQGEAGPQGGPRGDLYVHISVAPDPQLTREGDDLVCEVSVPFTLAALGGSVRVDTLEGKVDLKIPAGTQPGAQLRLRGLGMHRFHGHGRGDQRVRVQVEIPRKLSARQKELLEELRRS